MSPAPFVPKPLITAQQCIQQNAMLWRCLLLLCNRDFASRSAYLLAAGLSVARRMYDGVALTLIARTKVERALANRLGRIFRSLLITIVTELAMASFPPLLPVEYWFSLLGVSAIATAVAFMIIVSAPPHGRKDFSRPALAAATNGTLRTSRSAIWCWPSVSSSWVRNFISIIFADADLASLIGIDRETKSPALPPGFDRNFEIVQQIHRSRELRPPSTYTPRNGPIQMRCCEYTF